MAPAPAVSVAPLIVTPATLFVTLVAATVEGVAPPPRTILPPFERIDVPDAREIAPPPVASESEFSVTSSFCVLDEASILPPVSKATSRFAFSVNVLAAALLCVMAVEILTSFEVPVDVIALVTPLSAKAPAVVMSLPATTVKFPLTVEVPSASALMSLICTFLPLTTRTSVKSLLPFNVTSFAAPAVTVVKLVAPLLVITPPACVITVPVRETLLLPLVLILLLRVSRPLPASNVIAAPLPWFPPVPPVPAKPPSAFSVLTVTPLPVINIVFAAPPLVLADAASDEPPPPPVALNTPEATTVCPVPTAVKVMVPP